mgnify:CR=1 FL=1
MDIDNNNEVKLPRNNCCLPGPTGPRGYMGSTGPSAQGRRGKKGDKGMLGDTGPCGPTGCTGATGARGSRGFIGKRGHTGDIGPTGCSGPIGSIGEKGRQGPTGASGCPGDTGCTGATGKSGDRGIHGLRGHTGPDGPTGCTGARGIQGKRGPPGPKCDCTINTLELNKNKQLIQGPLNLFGNISEDLELVFPKRKITKYLLSDFEFIQDLPDGIKKVGKDCNMLELNGKYFLDTKIIFDVIVKDKSKSYTTGLGKYNFDFSINKYSRSGTVISKFMNHQLPVNIFKSGDDTIIYPSQQISLAFNGNFTGDHIGLVLRIQPKEDIIIRIKKYNSTINIMKLG